MVQSFRREHTVVIEVPSGVSSFGDHSTTRFCCLAVVAPLCLAGCASSGSAGSCDRAKYFNGEDLKPAYLLDMVVTFRMSDQGIPGRGMLTYQRLVELEKYCWQTRATD